MKKPSWEWTEDDLQELKKVGAQESLYLEFKGWMSLQNRDREKNELSKDVSAFANSEGGDILYGVREDGEPPSRFADVDEGINPSDIAPEWLEQVISSRIQRRINGVRIKPIELKNSRPGRVVYLVHVPPSFDAPHQAVDKKYYKRFNFQSVPMEDYEVRDVRNRRLEPIVVAEVSGKSRTPEHGWSAGRTVDIRLSIVLKNIGTRMAQHIYLECNIPDILINPGVFQFGLEYKPIQIEEQAYRQLWYHHRDNSGSLPLFPNTSHEVLDGNRRYANLKMLEKHVGILSKMFIYWAVYADGGQPQEGRLSVAQLFGLP